MPTGDAMGPPVQEWLGFTPPEADTDGDGRIDQHGADAEHHQALTESWRGSRALIAAPAEGPATIELQSDSNGVPLVLSERQKTLIQLQNPDASRVFVKKLPLLDDDSLLLQTVGMDASGRPEEPTVTKLAVAAALADELERQASVRATLGPYAARVLRRPLSLGEDSAVVLDLPNACWCAIDAPAPLTAVGAGLS